MKDYVLITGCTSGIGYEIAKIFAAKGRKLILVSRNKEKLQKVNQTLVNSDENVIICSDLSRKDSARTIYEETRRLGVEVDILINNAGAGYVGEFVETDEEKTMALMTLNMESVTLLTRYFAKDMKKRRKGKILNVASTGSYHPGPYTALYYASKAYVLSLSEALYEELKPYGVSVCSLCPGATATHFAEAAGRADTKIAMKPAFVAQKAYEGLMKNKRVIIPGIQNRLFVRIPKCIAIQLIKRYQSSLQREIN